MARECESEGFGRYLFGGTRHSRSTRRLLLHSSRWRHHQHCQNGIRWTEFQNILDALPSKVLLLADTCHGGSITGKTERARGAPSRDLTRVLRASLSAGSGVVVMTASTEYEDSYENDKWKHGAFTKALLDGLSGQADYDVDRSVYIRELDHFVAKRVQN